MHLEYLLDIFCFIIDLENAPEYMGSWTEDGGKGTFAVSNHLTWHALLINTWESMISINTLLVGLIGMSARVSTPFMMDVFFTLLRTS